VSVVSLPTGENQNSKRDQSEKSRQLVFAPINTLLSRDQLAVKVIILGIGKLF
jgi:hypothetical protein